MAQFAANPTDYYSGNLFLGEDIFLDFEKADFDSVWGESLTTGIPSDWLSEEEDILFDILILTERGHSYRVSLALLLPSS